MTRYEDPDEIAAEALQLCEDVREIDRERTYRRLAVQCVRDPERMTQVLMCLAIWVDPDVPISVLGDRAEAIAATRDRRAS